MKSYSVGALCFLAGVSLGILVLAPTVRLVPTLTARVKQLEKQVTEAKVNGAQTQVAATNVYRAQLNRARALESRIEGLEQENYECESRCPYYIPDKKGGPHA